MADIHWFKVFKLEYFGQTKAISLLIDVENNEQLQPSKHGKTFLNA